MELDSGSSTAAKTKMRTKRGVEVEVEGGGEGEDVQSEGAKRVKVEMEREGEGERKGDVGMEMVDEEANPSISTPKDTSARSGVDDLGKKSKQRRGDNKAKAKETKGTKAKEKKKEWVGRRRGTRPDSGGGEEALQDGEEEKAKAPRLPKRQCALLIGFCGSGYKGMQIQPNERTIENTLFKALVAAGAVSKDNADDPVKVGIKRAARTDAGVHAAGNVVSMKMITRVPEVPDLLAKINEELPPEIRLWSFQRVQNSFNARLSCDSRRYTYFFPSYMLIPPKPTSALYQSFARQSQSQSSSSSSFPTTTVQPDPFWQEANLETSRAEDIVRKKTWRVSKEKVEALREAAKRFEGTHNFHNFTVGRDVKDRSCMRHMKKIEVADPVVYGETEWISVMLHGQSFMLHQRKMMCVLVMAVRTGTPSNIINALYGPPLVTIPKMPSLGLLLENPIFESYNNKIERANDEKELEPDHPDYRGAISFEKHAEEMQKFKKEHIYTRMRDSEEKLQIFDRWQTIFDRYNGNDLLYYNAQGTIPEAAIIKRGQSRPNPFRERKRFDATEFAPDLSASKLAEEAEEQEEEEAESEEEEEEEEKMGKKELEEAEG